MNETKSELRPLLDLLENAGFIITDYHANKQNKKISITLYHGNTAITTSGEIISLFETNAYRVMDYGVAEVSSETVCITVIPLQGVK